jgi:hypothetical protein
VFLSWKCVRSCGSETASHCCLSAPVSVSAASWFPATGTVRAVPSCETREKTPFSGSLTSCSSSCHPCPSAPSSGAWTTGVAAFGESFWTVSTIALFTFFSANVPSGRLTGSHSWLPPGVRKSHGN